METLNIDFEKLIKEPRKLIAGREVGRNFRAALGGDESFLDVQKIIMSVPETTKVITPSVFLGLMGSEIQSFGNFNEAIDRIVLKGATTVTEDNFKTAIRTTFVEAL